jgi:hypothetical protein
MDRCHPANVEDATLASSTLVSSKAAMIPAAFACTSVSLPA